MRKVYAHDYAVKVAEAIDRATGLTVGQELVKSRKRELEREAELEEVHTVFIEAVSGILSPDSIAKFRSKTGIASVGKMILAAADLGGDGGDEKPMDKRH